MEPGTPNGIAARVEILERQQSETFRRLGRIETRQAEIGADLRNVGDDVVELKGGVSSTAADCQAVRAWVDARLKEEGDRRRLSRGEIFTFAAVFFGALGSIFGALSALGAIG